MKGGLSLKCATPFGRESLCRQDGHDAQKVLPKGNGYRIPAVGHSQLVRDSWQCPPFRLPTLERDSLAMWQQGIAAAQPFQVLGAAVDCGSPGLYPDLTLLPHGSDCTWHSPCGCRPSSHSPSWPSQGCVWDWFLYQSWSWPYDPQAWGCLWLLCWGGGLDPGCQAVTWQPHRKPPLVIAPREQLKLKHCLDMVGIGGSYGPDDWMLWEGLDKALNWRDCSVWLRVTLSTKLQCRAWQKKLSLGWGTCECCWGLHLPGLPHHISTSIQSGLKHKVLMPLIIAGAQENLDTQLHGSWIGRLWWLMLPVVLRKAWLLAEVTGWRVLVLGTMCLQNIELTWSY